MEDSPIPLYSERLDDALGLVARDFRHRVRKGTTIPYLSHLLAVAAMVAEHGGDEEQIAAAVLHDWLEDVEWASVAELERRFGPRVARLVEAVTDTTSHPKPPWRERKEAWLARIAAAPPEVKLVSVADKLHNIRSVLRDYRALGEPLWGRFRGGRTGSLWYFRAVHRALGTDWSHPLLDELGAEVRQLHRETGTLLPDLGEPDPAPRVG